ncbi:MAG: glycoside hydrolase family 32 protein [Aggregatilineales bacterium]
MIENTLENLDQLRSDFHRPQYHFLPPSNWMNDPNGLIQWNGIYHLFFQYNPYGPLWGNMSWGHAISDDLIHWKHLPLALEPTQGGPDEAGCFSGCAVDDHGVPTILYTSTSGDRNEIQTQSIATSQDNLITWTKHPSNPVLVDVPPELNQTIDFRDPFVWNEGHTWFMVLGSRIKDIGGAVLLYRSHDLIEWEYLNPLLVGDDKRHDHTWECPNFFKIRNKWVLIISTNTGSMAETVLYFVGNYENFRFTPEFQGVMDYGSLYAPLSFVDDKDRRILFGWLREARSEVDQRLAGWSGAQSIPRVLGLDEQNRLIMQPVVELERIRGAHHAIDSTSVSGEIELDVRSLHLDVVAEFAVEPGGYCGFSFACSTDRNEQIGIIYDSKTSRLRVSKTYPEAYGSLTTHIREVDHPLSSDETLKLRILLDGSVAEVIANERTSLTSRFYPSDPNHNHVLLHGVNAKLETLDIWEMPSIW